MRKISIRKNHPIHPLALAAALVPLTATCLLAATPNFLDGLRKTTMLTSTVPSNGDVNPYALVVSPVSIGKIRQGDVLVDNFNDKNNLQGVGTTIVSYRPETKATSLFASVPKDLPSCPGGVGMTTAMTVLKSGYVIVGSLPSKDGTFKTAGPGCLIVFDADGKFVKTLADDRIDGPWGNAAIIDNGATATLFISQIGAGKVPSATQSGKLASVLRLDLAIDKNGPRITKETVIGDGFGERADKDVFVMGPTGLVLDGDTLYVSDAINNSVDAIPNALKREDSAGVGELISKDGMFKRPLALEKAPNGHLLVINGLDGEIIEVDPVAKKQVASRWINTNKAQTPPGSGNLFGVALAPDEKSFYFVNDDVNTLAIEH